MDWKKTLDKYQNLLFCAACVVAVIAGGVYFYGILHAFVPNSEDLWTTQQWYLILTGRASYAHRNVIYDLVSCLSVGIGGLSYFSIRLQFTLLYMIVWGLSLYLCVSRAKGQKRWFLLLLWIFFGIMIHTVQDGADFGKLYADTDLIWQFPYCYHITEVIFALICLITVQSYLNAATSKKKIVLLCIGLGIGVYALRFTDLIFYVVFALPCLVVLLIHGIYHHKTRKYALPFILICAGMILLTKFLSGQLFSALWTAEKVRNAYGTIYGATNWLDVDGIFSHITNYIKLVLLLFNIDLSNRPILSMHSILFVIRIVFIITGYAIVAKTVVYSIRGRMGQHDGTLVDEILAWSVVIVSCSFIFTQNGENLGSLRYYSSLVPMLMILLCRNLEKMVARILPVIVDMPHKKVYLCGICGILCICQAEPVWQYQTSDSYLEDCEQVITYLEQRGALDDGYALAPYWLCCRLSAMTGGEILFFSDERQVRNIYGEDADIRFVIIAWGEEEGKETVLAYEYEDVMRESGNYEEWCERYRTPVWAVDLDHFYVCEFE